MLESNGNGVLRNLPNQCQHPTPLTNCCRLPQNHPHGNHVRTSLLPSFSRALPTLTLEHGRCKQCVLPSGVVASRHSSAVSREHNQRHLLLRLLLAARGSTASHRQNEVRAQSQRIALGVLSACFACYRLKHVGLVPADTRTL